jgi:hypothetical protein
MSGGAYAASRYIISSTRQISPKVLKALKGNAGATGKTGATGPAGPAGATGSAGTNGTNGSPGSPGSPGTAGASVVSKKVAAGAHCTNGGSEFTASGSETTYACNGTDGTTGFTETLPEGETEMGAWTAFFPASTETEETFVSISFPIPLKEPVSDTPTDHTFYVTLEEQKGENGKIAPEQCTGTAEAPTAASGDLCLYEGSAHFPSTEPGEPSREPVVGSSIYRAGTKAGTAGTGIGTTGSIVFVRYPGGTEDESAFSYGSFAVTAE